jgi:hypothetical protein
MNNDILDMMMFLGQREPRHGRAARQTLLVNGCWGALN